ncbi:M55 family metallopeptidase [Streptomyces sp. NPDC007095]|uniref:M55 family metallopeptidase n=1 Tax=Streptomyces sp. NPDC007095 TaxID=3154482 RepID=UPI0033C5A1F2
MCGALDAGTTRILVNDAHGPMRNLLADQLHQRHWRSRSAGRCQPCEQDDTRVHLDRAHGRCVGTHDCWGRGRPSAGKGAPARATVSIRWTGSPGTPIRS